MCAVDRTATTRFDELAPGDRIAVQKTVTIGSRSSLITTMGTVVRTERAYHGHHFACNVDDEVFHDMILLELPDGELTFVVIDELTVLNRA